MAPAGAPKNERASTIGSNGAVEAACQRRIARMTPRRNAYPKPAAGKAAGSARVAPISASSGSRSALEDD
jgi:hypothetical protein